MMHATASVQVRERRALPLRQPPARLLIAAAMACAVIAAAAVLVVIRRDAPGQALSAPTYPARLVHRFENPAARTEPASVGWNEPAGIVTLGERQFVLDTGNNRVLELNGEGAIVHVLDPQPPLNRAMAIASDGRYLYVANSGTAQILVLTPDGSPVRVVPVGGVPGDALPARPIGLVVGSDGDVFVSDAANHRVLRYDAEGRLLWAVGKGHRATGEEGFNTPAGLALDGTGNLYAVDILNGRVVKLAPDGRFLGQYGRLGDTAGALARPKDVAIDAAGNVYVSDGLLAAVQVFGPSGDYRGFIGLKDPADRKSGALFRAPAGLSIAGSNLYVVDRLSSVFVLALPDAP